jgi:DNA-binding GntR family transcriptional regulator
VPGRNQNSFSEHKGIYEALKARDEKKAAELVKQHIENVRRTIEQNYNFLL